MFEKTKIKFDERSITSLYSNKEKIHLLVEYIEDPRGSILGPIEDQNLTTEHSNIDCPLCNFPAKQPEQIIRGIHTIRDFPCLLTTVTREYAPNHRMVVSVNPHPQHIFSDKALYVMLGVLEGSEKPSQVWFNSKGAGAGIYTHFHFHISRLYAPLWLWLDNQSQQQQENSRDYLVRISEIKHWPARVRLYEASNRKNLMGRLSQDLSDLNLKNIPYTILCRLSSKGTTQAILCPRIWSNPHSPTVLLFPSEGPYLWYPRLGAPGVPGGVIYVVGKPTNLTNEQRKIMLRRAKHEMHKLSEWLWSPEKQR